MKRSLIIVVPLLLLAVLNACSANGALPPYSSDQWTAIAMTQQVMAWPDTERIKAWLNTPINYDKFDSLEGQLVGNYDVLAVVFPNGTFFQIVLNCRCTSISSSSCCDPERMFLITLMKIDGYQNHILPEIPETVQTMDLVCLNNTAAFSKVSAPWEKVKGFLIGVVSAEDLKSSVSVQGIP